MNRTFARTLLARNHGHVQYRDFRRLPLPFLQRFNGTVIVRHRRPGLLAAALMVSTTNAAPARSAPVATPAAQRSDGDEQVSEREPLVRFEADRDVFLPEEVPRIFLEWLGPALDRRPSAAGQRGDFAPMTLAVNGPHGPLRRRCPARQQLQRVNRSSSSAEYYVVGPDCYRFSRPGRYRLTAAPRSLPEELRRAPNARLAATLFIRVVERAPPTGRSSEGVALSLQALDDRFLRCAIEADDFRVVRHRDEVFVEAAGKQSGIPFPSALETVLPLLKTETGLKKRPPVASALQSTGRGWLVGTNAGDPGGRLLTVESPGLTPLSFETGYGLASSRRYCAGVTECWVPQDVAAIERDAGAGDSFFVFQGHDDSGRISKLSWQDGRWSARVLADLHREPGAWIRRPSSSWLVVTGAGLLEVTPDGNKTMLAHLPTLALRPSSLVELPSGAIWIGLRGGALRLTPTWQEVPQYWPEFVVRSTSRLAKLAAWGVPCP